jgi:hypothetical protein
MGWRGFGFVHHSRTVFCRAVSNPDLTIRHFCIAVDGSVLDADRGAEPMRGAARGTRCSPRHGDVHAAPRNPAARRRATLRRGVRPGEALPLPFFRYRRLRIQGDQGRGRVRTQVHVISVPFLLIIRFYC